MQEQDKKLLIKDICARLPYGIIANYIPFMHNKPIIGKIYLWGDKGDAFCIKKIDKYQDKWDLYENWTSSVEIDKFKPYLRPMSSITAEEKNEYDKTFALYDGIPIYTIETFDWLNAHYFDYRGLIVKGLALEAPEDMYNF